MTNINPNTPMEKMTPGGDIYTAGNAREFKTGDWRSIKPIFISGSWRTFKPILDKEKCIDCDNCIIFCPDSCVNKQHDINYDYCKGCGVCAKVCPFKAIEMKEE